MSIQAEELAARLAPGLDLEALRQKYREERDKRMRPDGLGQYLHIDDDYAEFEADPWAEPLQRAPLTDAVDVALIGGGYGALITAALLRQRGVHDLRIIEKGGDLGGTWYWNRYPGLACDTESYIYLPLLDETGYVPTEKYASGAEIQAYLRSVARRYQLYDKACLQTEVTDLRWDEERARWIIATDRGDRMEARFVVLATGFLQKAKLPRIPGLRSFQGRMFHTSRWDYGYTGGDARGNLTGLRDRNVGLIGTGATAVQCVPHLGASAGQLFVFQRTPSSIDVRNNRPTDPQWAASLEPGWQRRRVDNFQLLTAGGTADEDLVNDGWTDITYRLQAMLRALPESERTPEAIEALEELVDFIKMEELRARVDALVEDPATAAALKPWYRRYCKRPCFHDEYLQTFNRPNVSLVDTHGQGVERITPRGVIANGREYPLDCLIFATGFEVGTDFASRGGFDPVGRNGRSLSAVFAEGMQTLHGMHIHGFPNCYLMSMAQSVFSVNFAYLLNEQARHIASVVGDGLERGARTLEATPEATAAWTQAVYDRGARSVEFARECTPGYYNNEGRLDRHARQTGSYYDEPLAFAQLLERWRAAGTLEGLEITLDPDPGERQRQA